MSRGGEEGGNPRPQPGRLWLSLIQSFPHSRQRETGPHRIHCPQATTGPHQQGGEACESTLHKRGFSLTHPKADTASRAVRGPEAWPRQDCRAGEPVPRPGSRTPHPRNGFSFPVSCGRSTAGEFHVDVLGILLLHQERGASAITSCFPHRFTF